MPAGRKKAVSLRLSASDLTKIRRVAKRLDVRDSDVIRFAIKNLLVRLSPLTDPSLTGSALVPLFLGRRWALGMFFWVLGSSAHGSITVREERGALRRDEVAHARRERGVARVDHVRRERQPVDDEAGVVER